MREILFKAKKTETGEWIEGFYHFSDWTYPNGKFAFRKHYILPARSQDAFEIDPDTLCQYIGTEDKNGKKIFENDVVTENSEGYIGNIFYADCKFEICWNKFNASLRHDIRFWKERRELEVIGNIFDNPELL